MRAALAALFVVAGAAAAEPTLAPAGPLCVTLGKLVARDGQQHVESDKMRAVTAAPRPPSAELRFTYLGPTATTSALASGAVRRQIGLKLLAADGCNLLYVMWRLDPQPGLVVSLKRNPGQHLSLECGNRGYRNVTPRRSAPLPSVAVGVPHRLAAALVDGELTVQADGAPVWSGPVPPETAQLSGPVGIRSDNGRFALDLRAPPAAAAAAPCPRGEAD